MPSPFPGMDPYLESPDWFPDLHGNLIFVAKEMLQRKLPASYYAQSSQRVWLEYSRRHVEPDVEVVRSARKAQGRGRGGGLAVLAESREGGPLVVTVETIEHGPFKESFLEIRQRRGKEIQVVTTIEVLSPSNKKKGDPGRAKFLAKQRETLESETTHLVEIDLLRGGVHTLAVPRDLAVARAGPFDYMVSIHRFHRTNEFLVYPIALPQRLPEISIPLLPGDPDVPLDLQAVFDRSYDAGPYRREVDYGTDPIVPRLSPKHADWIRASLKRTD
jgi:hypothetical protein